MLIVLHFHHAQLVILASETIRTIQCIVSPNLLQCTSPTAVIKNLYTMSSVTVNCTASLHTKIIAPVMNQKVNICAYHLLLLLSLIRPSSLMQRES
jgi:hypothetical protein